MMRIYGYLRASTDDQDAGRAKQALQSFADEKGQKVSSWFRENESGATLQRPELFRLLDVAQEGDALLIEQVDRISRLNEKDWNRLKLLIRDKGIRIIALDLPTSHQFISTGDEFTQRMLAAINDMMLDMLAAVARKDYMDRRRRQAEGIDKAKREGKYRGRRVNRKLHDNIEVLLGAGKSYREIIDILNCSPSTVAKVRKRMQKVLS